MLRDIETNNRSVRITENITIEGRVTANSEYGEFYNAIIIEDQSAAVKILYEISEYSRLPFGSCVHVNCSGLYLINHYGGLTLGAQPTGEYTLDYIPQSRVDQYIKPILSNDSGPIPLRVDIADLTPLHTYRFVILEDITIQGDGSKFCRRDPITGRTVDTRHTIIDSDGNSAELFVSRHCDYADELLPTSPCTIGAIVDYFNESYSIRITNYAIEQ